MLIGISFLNSSHNANRVEVFQSLFWVSLPANTVEASSNVNVRAMDINYLALLSVFPFKIEQ